MQSFFKKYRKIIQHKHGWEIELQCPKCNHRAIPKYNGWIPGYSKSFGNTPWIYAKLQCPDCENDLKNEAGNKLVDLFQNIRTANKHITIMFIGLILFITILIILKIIPSPLAIGLLLAPMIIYFNYKSTSALQKCDCNAPNYIFMGMLGRTCCYRCSTCGKLKRLR